MGSDASDSELLLDRARAGDDDAVNRLLVKNRRRLRSVIGVRLDPRLASRVDPSDVVQETLLEAHRQFDEYLRTEPLPVFPWLRRVAFQKLLQLERKHLASGKRSIHREDQFGSMLSDESVARLARRLLSSESGPVHRLVLAEQKTRVRAALEQLAETDRELLVMHYMERLAFDEIGSILGLRDSALKMRHLRALKRLRSLLDKPGN
jgi:RNA polymerase sigma-70 factor (ECF subfamily)